MQSFDLSPLTAEQRQALMMSLDHEEQRVLLHRGTEAPFCGAFLDHHKDGVYCCRLCGLPLFHSQSKFDSGTGWPSFFTPFAPSHIKQHTDTSHGMLRTEIVCARCDSHLGHVFPDGPPPTGERYCLNAIALEFIAKGQNFPNRLQRQGAEAGQAS